MLALLLSKHIVYTDVLEKPADAAVRYSENFYDYVLDHFTPVNHTLFKQRYYVNDQFYDREQGVVVVHIGGEGELKSTSVTGKYSGFSFASNMSALLVALEHRFYGQSSPEVEPSDLQFLTTEQAIADYSTFIPFIKAQYGAKKVMVMGGSYPGAMAVILRAQLPHLVDAALSSSAPLLAKYDYTEYLQHVQAQVSAETRASLAVAYYELRAIAQDSDRWADFCGHMNISAEFCDFSSALNQTQLYETFTDAFAGVVQYAKPAKYDGALEVGQLEYFELNVSACTGDAMCVLDVLNTFGGSCAGCEHTDYDTMIRAFQGTSNDARRMWYFQTCNEYAYYYSAQFEDSIFPQEIDLNYFTQVCLDAFYRPMGIADTMEAAVALNKKAVDIANWQRYGARNYPRDKIWYTVGSVDPWTELAMNEDLSWEAGKFRHPDTYMSVIAYGSHCSDMYLEWTINDEIRQLQLQTFRNWLELN